MGSEEVCYGFESVQTIVDGHSDGIDETTELGTTDWLAGTLIIDTSPLDLASQSYGVAPIRVRANLPVGHPDRDLVMIPMGGIELGNGVPYEEALLLPSEEEALEIVTATTATLYEQPSTSSPIAGTVPAGTIFIADGTTLAQDWLRVYFEYPGEYDTKVTAWINRSALQDVDTDLLPFASNGNLTPMQKFYFNNTFGASPCPGTPAAALLMQAPKGVGTQFIVNDAEIEITSSVSLNIREPNIMELRVLDGFAVLCPNTPNEIIVPEGFAIELPLTTPPDVQIADRLFHSSSSESCDWQNLRLMTNTELEDLSLLENLRTNVLNQPVTLPNIVCPSAVGPAQCVVTIDDADTRDTVQELCDDGSISEQVCELVR
ncbi:MAG: SH3 domain-containing protein [Anaerolineae bacterium]|nr:SH3 domain-containing protein [Anaerolineae bacterium]